MRTATSEVLYSFPRAVSLPASRVKTIHRRMHPQSRSFLVSTTDTATYVMKGLAAMGGADLVKEVVGSELARQLQLPMASWRTLELDQQTLDAHGHVCGTAEPGIYFGSRVPIEAGSFFEYLPSSKLQASPQARVDAALIQIFDLWVGQCEPRQYLARPEVDGAVSLKFIRNSAILGDPSFDMLQAKNALPVYLRACLLAGSRHHVQAFIGQILQWSSSSLAETLAGLPTAWTAGFQAKGAMAFLIRRQDLLGKLWLQWQAWTPEKAYSAMPVSWDAPARKERQRATPSLF